MVRNGLWQVGRVTLRLRFNTANLVGEATGEGVDEVDEVDEVDKIQLYSN
jgi:hypothetical protein